MNKRLLATTFIMAALAATAYPQGFSTSVMRPTPIDPTTGVITGQYPGGTAKTNYYFAADLQRGDLVSQISFSGRPNVDKNLEFELLNSSAQVAASYYIMSGLDANQEATKSFPIDSAGRYTIRLILGGPETTSFCVLLGGSALPNVKSPGCEPQGRPATPPPPPTTQPKFEVIESKCEQRLRIGSDILFDFDRANLRPEAGPTLDAVAQKVKSSNHPVLIEGYTDAKGTDSYNQSLSERRADSVQATLVERGVSISRLKTHGYGKSRPVAPNQKSDGSDDPEGRQKNRRVEIVINTCQ